MEWRKNGLVNKNCWTVSDGAGAGGSRVQGHLELEKVWRELGLHEIQSWTPHNPTEANNRKSRCWKNWTQMSQDSLWFLKTTIPYHHHHAHAHRALWPWTKQILARRQKPAVKGGREAKKLDFIKMKVTIKNCQDKGWVRWSITLVPVLRRWRLADLFEFKVSLV